MRERMLTGGCLLAAVAAGWVGWDQFGFRPLTQHVPQEYGPGDLTVAFLAALVIWLCVHAATLARRSETLSAVHGAALAVAIAAFAYLHWPPGYDRVGVFAYVTNGDPPHWGRDVALLVAALFAGLALPTLVALRQRRPATPGPARDTYW